MTRLRERLLAEPPNPPPYVLEDMAAAEPRLVVRALGTDWLATKSAWISIGWLAVLGQIMARVVPGRSGPGRAVAGLGFTGLTGFSMIAHQIGTIAVANSLGAPMRGVVFTATLAYNTYPEEPRLPATVHMLRALGGPAGNLLLGVVALKLHRRLPRIRALAYLGWLNVLFTCAALIPVPTMDGGAAIRAWRQRKGRELQLGDKADE
jgi:Zn-dependent protease